MPVERVIKTTKLERARRLAVKVEQLEDTKTEGLDDLKADIKPKAEHDRKPKKAQAVKKERDRKPKREADAITVDGKKICIENPGAFDRFWEYTSKRQLVDDRRRAGLAPPWTDDPILANTKFCNIFRVADRGSQFIIKNVIERGSKKPVEVLFRVLVYNTFSNPATWDLLESKLGEVSWSTYTREAYERVLGDAKARGIALYTSAYQKPAPRLGFNIAYMNHLSLIEAQMDTDLLGKLTACQYMEDAYTVLAEYQGMGAFNTHQLLLDISYTSIINFSECDFVIAGLGAHAGLKRIFDPKALNTEINAKIIRWLQENQREHLQKRGLEFRGLQVGDEAQPRLMQLVDVEHTLCEFEKYERYRKAGNSHAKKFDADAAGVLDLIFPQAWSHPDRQVVKVKPGKAALKVQKRYLVEKILKHRGEKGKGREFYVKWEGYKEARWNTWEPEALLEEDAPLVVQEYYAQLR